MMSAAVAETTIRPIPSYTTLRNVTGIDHVSLSHGPGRSVIGRGCRPAAAHAACRVL
jgi:hypothetical protein